MSTKCKIEQVVIVGGGTAGWIAAALLVKVLGRAIKIKLIESEEIGTIGVGEATIPPLQKLNRVLGLNEAQFVSATQGSFKLGIDFVNWTRIGERYMHTFGTIGKDARFCDFVSLWRRSLDENKADSLWDYSLNYQAARQNRFAKIPREQRGILGNLAYAYHFDAGLYARFLRAYSEKRGVSRVEGKVDKVNKDKDTGFISSVCLEDGQEIAADFFIDCSGMRSLLLGEALGSEFEDWGEWLLCDRALAVQSRNQGEPPPYTVSTAEAAGWQWRIPLQHRTGNGLVYSSQYMSEDEARETLLKNLQGEPMGEPRLIKFRTGMRKEQWKANCVAIGLAGGFIEPLESTSIHFIQRALFKLLDKFPHRGIQPEEVNQYNQEFAREFYNVRDFIILHYHLNQRDEEFWVKCREMEIPDSLRRKIEIFRTTGKVYRDPEVLFTQHSWYQVMLGQGVMPEDYHPFADTASPEELNTMLEKLRTDIERQVSRLSSHQDFINRYCPARAMD